MLLTLRHPPLQFAVLILFCEFPRDSTFSRQRFGLINRIIRAVVRKIKFLFYLPTGGNKSFWSVGRTFLSARFLERGVDIPVFPVSVRTNRAERNVCALLAPTKRADRNVCALLAPTKRADRNVCPWCLAIN